MRADPRASWCLLALACALGGCDVTVAAPADAAAGDGSVPMDGGAADASTPRDAATDGGQDAGSVLPPRTVEPCEPGRPMSCWPTLMTAGACGTTARSEDFSTDLYNVHTFAVSVRAGVGVEIGLRRTGGAWDPALVLHDASGATIFDGERGVVDATLAIEAVETGRGADVATVRISSTTDLEVSGFLTAWHVIDGAFEPRMPTDATYTLTVTADCEPPDGLLSPPNFDETDVVGGYHILPESDPSGLYTRKARCSRGNRLLIDVLYTVAVRWSALHPEYAPIAISDLNECDPRLAGDADHATHDDGTHADLSAGCATRVGCDLDASVDLAKLFIDTGESCGIIFDDPDVQAIVNPYFRAEHAYTPWHGGAERTFMRTVGGHTRHFHVRVRRPDGTCVPL